MTADIVAAAARRLRDAETACTACEPVRDLIPAGDLDTAYAVQSANADLGLSAGRRIVGRKIGLTNPAVQAQLGVGQPDFGVLFADMAVEDGDAIMLSAMIAPRVEAEVAFVLGHDLVHERSTAADVLRATEFLLPAIEIVDSRVRDWDISIVDTIADNGSSGRYVLGTTPRRVTDVDVRAVTMEIVRHDGVQVSAGNGAACLGNPVNAVVWLANALVARGTHLRAGDVVLSGALGPMARVQEPGSYEAMITGLGDMRVAFV
jgi:2-keto-4-pentenoate hydratase